MPDIIVEIASGIGPAGGGGTDVDVEDDASLIVAGVEAINFNDDLEVVNDNDGSVTVNATGASADSRSDVSKDGSLIVSDATDINFTDTNDMAITVSNDGDGSATVDFDVTDTRTDVANASGTVQSETEEITFTAGGDLSVNVQDDGDGTSTVQFSGSISSTDVSDDGTLVVSETSDINFGSDLDVTDDGDGSVTVAATGSGSDTHTDVSDGGSLVVSDADDINFDESGAATSTVANDGDGSVTVTAGVDQSLIDLANVSGELTDVPLKTNGDTLSWNVTGGSDLTIRNTTDSKDLFTVDQDTGDATWPQLGGTPTFSTHDHSESGVADIGLGGLAAPFALPSISDLDLAGNDLDDGATTVWDASLNSGTGALTGPVDNARTAADQLVVPETGTQPIVNGEFRQDTDDVYVGTGGGVKNLSDIGTGAGSGTTVASGSLGTLSASSDYADFTLAAVTADVTTSISSVSVTPSDSQSLSGEYPFHAEWSVTRDYTNGETDVFIRVVWDTDTRPSNISLDYAIYEGVGGGTSSTVTVQEDGSAIGTADTINAGSNITATMSGDTATLSASGGGGGGLADGSLVTASNSPFDASADTHYPADTSSGAVTINLPASPSDRDQVLVTMVADGGTDVTIDGNSNNIEGSATRGIASQYTSKLAQYFSATGEWVFTT